MQQQIINDRGVQESHIVPVTGCREMLLVILLLLLPLLQFHVLSDSDVRPSIDPRHIRYKHLFTSQLTSQPAFPRPAPYNYYIVQLLLLLLPLPLLLLLWLLPLLLLLLLLQWITNDLGVQESHLEPVTGCRVETLLVVSNSLFLISCINNKTMPTMLFMLFISSSRSIHTNTIVKYTYYIHFICLNCNKQLQNAWTGWAKNDPPLLLQQ